MKTRKKSQKRKLGPAPEDGTTQKTISSFFGRATKKDEPEGDRPASTSSSLSASPEKVGPGCSSQSITISTLDEFVSSSPRKQSTSGSTTSISGSTTSTSGSTTSISGSTTSISGSTTSISGSIKDTHYPIDGAQPAAKRKKSLAELFRGNIAEPSPQSSSSSAWEVDINDLPDEILETILCQIPHNDLVLQTTLVCKRWNNIVSSSTFMPNKKLYYAFKKTSGAHYAEAKEEVLRMIHEGERLDSSTCIVGFIRRMKSFITCSAGGSSPRIVAVLKKMPNYFAVEQLFYEQQSLEDCVENAAATLSSREPSPFCALAATFILAPDVDATSTLLRRLLVGDGIPTHLVLELFYAAATYFLAFHRFFNLPDLHHYIVFTAIYFFENQMQVDRQMLNRLFSRESTGQQSLVKFVSNNQFLRLTHEQFRIISSDIHPGEVIKINAFAGTGKTTTLIHYTQARPSLKFLYIAYNKAIKLDAEKRFPTNVVCRTMHSIAFKYKGWLYARHKKLANLKTRAVLEVLEKKKGFDQNLRASFAIKTIDSFIASNDRQILLNHVPRNNEHGEINLEFRNQHLQDALKIWEMMKDEKDDSVPMTHDGYLKLYQLFWKPDFAHTLRKTVPFDILLIDEAQDLTPACIDVLMRQTAPKILVGDPNQQIYSFRGAVNAMSLVQGSKVHYLTQSFRFGPQIAHMCDSLLTGMKGIDDRTIIGNPKNGVTHGGVVGQLCIISRTNFNQFVEAVQATDAENIGYWHGLENNNNVDAAGSKGKTASVGVRPTIAFTGQDKEDFLIQVLDVFRLYDGNKAEIRDPFIKRFDDFEKYAAYAKRVSDFEILGKCQIVRKYGKSTSKYVERIRRHMTVRLETADIVLTTAHKAKGLEFDTVKLSEDFLQGLERVDSLSLRGCQEDEKNLLYVAVSRAKKSLIMNETLVNLLRLFGEPFVTVRSNPHFQLPAGESSNSSAPPVPCVLSGCDKVVPIDNSWIVGRPEIDIRLPFETLTNENSVAGGCFCRKHGQLVLPAFASLLRPARNRPKPKEKIRFSFPAPDQEGDPEEEDENVAPGALPNPRDALDHFQGAFVRPRDLNAMEMNYAGDILNGIFLDWG